MTTNCGLAATKGALVVTRRALVAATGSLVVAKGRVGVTKRPGAATKGPMVATTARFPNTGQDRCCCPVAGTAASADSAQEKDPRVVGSAQRAAPANWMPGLRFRLSRVST